MINNINEKKLKKVKFKLFKLLKTLVLTTTLLGTLVGCNTQKDKEILNTTNGQITGEEFDNLESKEIEIRSNNATDQILDNETIFFSYGNTVYHSVHIEKDNITITKIKPVGGYAYSYVLDKKVNIPEINDNEMYVLDIDYNTKNIEIHTENLEKGYNK